MQWQLSATHAMGITKARIPACRPGLPTEVWPDDDTLVCDPTPDVASSHLLVAAAAQNYGQNGYRIRRPFDFADRTGTIVFDGTVAPMGILHGWISLAITEDPISMPGYALTTNDEGSIIPRNAVEVHFTSDPGGPSGITVRNVHVFRDHVDTVHSPPPSLVPADYVAGKLNHFEVAVAPDGIEVRISPYSADGASFEPPVTIWKIVTTLPFSRGWVHLSVHNHATMLYTQPGSGAPEMLAAPVALFDRVGFDGPVIGRAREYEVPDSLVPFAEPMFPIPLPDPNNPDGEGRDVGWFLGDADGGPAQTLHFDDVDPTDVVGAKVALSLWIDGLSQPLPTDQVELRVRLNGNPWVARRLTAAEAALFTDGPTTIDPDGAPLGDASTQGRLAIVVDVPPGDLVSGDNTIELVTANVPTIYPPIAANVDLILATE